MTIDISNNAARVNYTVASGVTQTSFSVPFEFFNDGDLSVYVDDVLKTITTHYTVSGGDGSTGTITMSVTGAAGGSTVVISRSIAIERTSDFQTGVDINRAALNTQLDTLTAIAADNQDKASRSISAPNSEVNPVLELPDADTRKGKLIGFNETTGNIELSATLADGNTLASISGDIATLADIEDGTDATDAIQTVAGISSNVTTVAGVSANVTTVAGNTTNINTVAGNNANITTVAGINSDVTTVSGISSDVTTVAADGADIGVVAGISSDVTSVAGVSSEISLLGTTDAIADMNILGTAAIVADMDSLADNVSAISIVSDDIGNVIAVAVNAANINTVAADGADIGTVAGDISNVNTVATNITSVNTNATNITDIQNASANAATATTQAGIATTKASEASASEVAAEAAKVAAEAALDEFTDIYLGAKASDPTTDNDGNALTAGDQYFNTTINVLKIYNGSAWQAAAIDSSGFVETTGDTMTGNLSFGDNDKAIFGAGSNLSIYTDGNTSFIQETGAGNFAIDGTNIFVRNGAGTANMAAFVDGGAATLYHNSSAKLATTSTGIDVTGTVTADGLTVGTKAFITADANVGYFGGDAAQTNHISFYDALDLVRIYTNGKQRVRIDSGGDISFYEDTGTTPKFFWDASAELLKIGSIDTIGTFPLMVKSNSTHHAIHIEEASGNEGYTLGVDADGDLGFYNSGSTTASVTFDDSGNVGIGTDSPYTTLDLSGGTKNQVAIFRSTDATATIGFADNSTPLTANLSYVTMGAVGSSMVFNTNLNERMRIDSSGNVGIGTDSPSEQLHLRNTLGGESGAILIEAFAPNIKFNDLSSPVADFQILVNNSFNVKRDSAGDGTFEATDLTIDSSGNVGIGTDSPDGNLTVGDTSTSGDVSIRIKGDASSRGFLMFGDSGGVQLGDIMYDHSDNHMRFRVSNSEAMRIDSSGRVGIGTSSPSEVLTVASSTRPRISITDTTNSKASMDSLIEFDGTDGRGGYISHTSGDLKIVNDLSGQNLQFGTVGTERMRIDASGRLGIGTSSPSYKLHIDNVGGGDGIALQDTNDGGSTGLYFLNNSGTIVASLAGLSDDTGMVFNTSGSEAMRIDSSGNLLVGKTSNDFSTEGAIIRPDGDTLLTRNGTVLTVRRNTTDGVLVDFRKDGTTVGSIGSVIGARLRIDSNSTAGYLGIAGTDRYYWNNTEFGVSTDNAYNLGSSGSRFKDLYLSGGVYLGGTGAANKLDDYEEGTFTPTAFGTTAAGTTTYAAQTGSYTKVGDTVHVDIYISWSAMTGTGNLGIGGLPFTSSSASNYYATGTIVPLLGFTWPSGVTQLNPLIGASATEIAIYGSATDSNSVRAATDSEIVALAITITYKV